MRGGPCLPAHSYLLLLLGQGALQVSSIAVEVTGLAGATLFPRESPHNFCYVVIDPVGRQVKCLYAAWFPMM